MLRPVRMVLGVGTLLFLVFQGTACTADPTDVEIPVEPLFSEVLLGSSPCPEDAPDCIPATEGEKELMRGALGMIDRQRNVYCNAAYLRIQSAIDNNMVDTFSDFKAYWMGQYAGHKRGSWNSVTDRYSFNRAFLGGSIDGVWDASEANLVKSFIHEAGAHATAGWGHNTHSDNEF